MARQWLRAGLFSFGDLVRKTKAARDRVIKTLIGWEREPDLAGIREPAQVAKLPAGEQKDCLQLWRDVSRTIEQIEQNQ